MITLVSLILMLMGTFFVFVAAIGLLRLPDVLMRMHAATKAGALGTALLLLSIALFFGKFEVALRALATMLFLFLTAPVAAHAIGRAAYRSGQVQLWEGTFVDELQDDTRSRRPGVADGTAGLATDPPAS